MHSKLFDWKLQRRFRDHALTSSTMRAQTMLWASDVDVGEGTLAMLRGCTCIVRRSPWWRRRWRYGGERPTVLVGPVL